MKSAFYEGFVRHRRTRPRAHEFTYRTFLVYLDLDELPSAFDRLPLWSARRAAPACFRRSDYLGDPQRPLREAVSDRVEEVTGSRPRGPIRMLTHLRYFGYCFNPVTFYYCFDPSDTRVDTIVAEIENTPWGERHAYVLDVPASGDPCRVTAPERETAQRSAPESARGSARESAQEVIPESDRGPAPENDPGQATENDPGPATENDARRSPTHRFRFRKQFHVSPFQQMDLDYDWRFREPGGRLAVHMVTLEQGSPSFDATLSLRRSDLTASRGLALLAKYPFLTLQVVVAIYWQAMKLKLKGFRFFPHPSKGESDSEVLSS